MKFRRIRMKSVTLIFIFCLFHYGSTVTYKAAVFEHYPSVSDSGLNTIRKNLDEYRQYADKAKAQGANILVFPEYGLTTLVTDPESYAVEVTDSDSIIVELKEFVKERGLFVVINLLEKVQEANKATKYYNTNLVFNRNGDIILKYRKINLINEPKLTPGASNQTLTFKTDFGVTFGIFTGYDIIFDNPSRRALTDILVTDIVFPSVWYATMPFYTALTVEHGYSIANGVNLLAANYGKPKEGHGGSGIYLADGKIAEAYIADSPSSKPIIQDVTKISQRVDKSTCLGLTPFGLPGEAAKSNVTDYKTTKNFEASKYTFKNVDLTQQNSSIEVCNNDLCCTFEVTVDRNKDTSTDRYKVMAFDGFLDYESQQYRTRICSLLACESDSPDSCGSRLNATSTKFTKLKVKGNVENEDGTYYVPVTLNSFLLPVRETTYCVQKNATNSSYIQFETIRAQENVLVFGIFGKTNISAASSIHAFGFFILVLFSAMKLVVF